MAEIVDGSQYELVLVVRSGDLEDLPGMLDEARKQVKKMVVRNKIEDVGGEDTIANNYCAGWFDFSIRNRDMVPDPKGPKTAFPIRVSA